jgi:hypothetical protein
MVSLPGFSLATTGDAPKTFARKSLPRKRRSGNSERNRGAPVDSGSTDHQTMVNEIVDVIATEGMVPREKLQDDATIESLD